MKTNKIKTFLLINFFVFNFKIYSQRLDFQPKKNGCIIKYQNTLDTYKKNKDKLEIIFAGGFKYDTVSVYIKNEQIFNSVLISDLITGSTDYSIIIKRKYFNEPILFRINSNQCIINIHPKAKYLYVFFNKDTEYNEEFNEIEFEFTYDFLIFE